MASASTDDMEKHGEKQDKLLPLALWCWSCKGVIIGATPVSCSLVAENMFKFTCERSSCKQTIMLIKKGEEWIPESGAWTEQEWEARCLNSKGDPERDNEKIKPESSKASDLDPESLSMVSASTDDMEKRGEKQDKLLPLNLWCWSCKGVIIGATPVSCSLVTENMFKFTCERASCKQTIMLIKKGEEWIPESGAWTEQEWEARCLNSKGDSERDTQKVKPESIKVFNLDPETLSTLEKMMELDPETKSTMEKMIGCGTEPVSVVCKKIAPDLIKEAVELGLENYGHNPTKVSEFLNGYTLLCKYGFSSTDVTEVLP